MHAGGIRAQGHVDKSAKLREINDFIDMLLDLCTDRPSSDPRRKIFSRPDDSASIPKPMSIKEPISPTVLAEPLDGE